MASPASSPVTRAWKGPYRIETKSLSYALPPSVGDLCWRRWYRVHADHHGKPILRNVTCEALPGEIMGIVGPSGAGKTTLLSVLAGAAHPGRVAGEVLLNGVQMDVVRFRRVSGYVTQDDALFPLLTVEESLAYSARLRLGEGRAKAAARVRELLRELGLDHVARSRVGCDGCGGISGGEKRRVSIGVELVHDPAVVLLDEPTSGLDSVSALHIVSLLKSMAKAQGKTVVLTIHQPGFRILELIDRVLLLAGGAVRHHGPLDILERRLESAGHLIPAHVNVLEYAMDALASLDAEAPISPGPNPTPSAGPNEDDDRVVPANPPLREVLILGERFFKNISRSKQLFMAKALQSLVAGLALSSVFAGVTDPRARVGFFAFSLTFLLSSTTEALPMFLQERRILARETSRGAYRVASYVAANALVFLPFLLAAALLYATPVYWLVGLRREADGFLWFALVVWLAAATANSFVACFSALVPNFVTGSSVIAGLMGAFFLFSGYFIAEESMPRYWVFVHYLSLFKYPFEAFLINEYGTGKGRGRCLRAAGEVCLVDGDMLLRQMGLGDAKMESRVGVMVAFICAYRVLCFVVLWFRCRSLRT
ncbi:hypothetical protein Taro_028855 [Colocasia esculenta]|uniref:ABC transporter domain-containing protein n=1 Tax=Colocasia esculenta TaxID=4460 RepID=A0A843VMA0_COLES|nr:hypothetical protein [Colocasia esculenta]